MLIVQPCGIVVMIVRQLRYKQLPKAASLSRRLAKLQPTESTPRFGQKIISRVPSLLQLPARTMATKRPAKRAKLLSDDESLDSDSAGESY